MWYIYTGIFMDEMIWCLGYALQWYRSGGERVGFRWDEIGYEVIIIEAELMIIIEAEWGIIKLLCKLLYMFEIFHRKKVNAKNAVLK